jgi:hypothetical protein
LFRDVPSWGSPYERADEKVDESRQNRGEAMIMEIKPITAVILIVLGLVAFIGLLFYTDKQARSEFLFPEAAKVSIDELKSGQLPTKVILD